MKTKKVGRKPKTFIRKLVITVVVVAGAIVIVPSAELAYKYVAFLQLEKKSAELPGLQLYSVQEYNHTKAYSWYADYPKIDQPAFDRATAKIANDAKGAFLAKVNYDATGKHPVSDLNISYAIDHYDDRFLSVSLTTHQVLEGKRTTRIKTVTYDRKAQRIVAPARENQKPPEDRASAVKNGPVPQANASDVDCNKVKCVALTFDDGPSYTTPQLLDTLKANNAKATFFELGTQSKLYPSIAKRIVREGHAIGNETYDHRNLLTAPSAEAKGDINRAADAIQSAGGVRPGLIRAPYGAVTATLAKKTNVPFIGWSVDAKDGKAPNADKIVSNVLSQVKPGAIVLSHDVYQTTVDAYGQIIPSLIKRGYTLVTVPQLLEFGKKVAPKVYLHG